MSIQIRVSGIGRIGLLAIATAVVAAAIIYLGGGGTGDLQLGTVGPMPNRVLLGPDRDVPCVEPEGQKPVCATPLPTLSDAEKSEVVPLRQESLAVSLDHLGAYRVPIGEAVLARGMVQRMDFSIANADEGLFEAPVFYLELEDATTKAVLPRNVYARGTVPGKQVVNVYLRFDLKSFEPKAVVEVTGITVE